jgi:hypothetical protein
MAYRSALHMAKIDHRIPTDLSQCERILERLMSLDIVSFFVTYERTCPEYSEEFIEANPGFPSLSDVAAKLRQGGYGRPDDFYWEVWGLFKTIADFHKDRDNHITRLFWALAEEATMRFMKYCEKEVMTETERDLRQLKRVQKDVADITMRPFFGQVSRAYETSSGPWFDPCDVPGKVDPIVYYEI